MHMIAPSLLLAAVSFATPLAFAQTLGEILDKGAKKLTPEAFRSEVVGKTLSGPGQQPRATIEVTYAAEHVTGVTGQAGAPNPYRGPWKVAPSGEVCADLFFELNRASRTACNYWFKLGDSYYISASDTDRGSAAYERTLKK
jgi:hypothetical protein